MKLPNAERAIVNIAKLQDYGSTPSMKKANTRPAFLPRHSAWRAMMRTGCAMNYWPLRARRIAGLVEKQTTDNVTFWISLSPVAANPRACEAFGTCGPARIFLD